MANFVPLSGWPQIKDLPGMQGRLDRIERIEAWKADTSYIEETGSSIEIDNCLGVPANKLSLTFAAQQDLHGYSKPWAGGAGKNKLPLSLANIKTKNTTGVWSDDTYALNGITYTVITNDGDNVIEIRVNGTATANAYLVLIDSGASDVPDNIKGTDIILSGCPVRSGNPYTLMLNSWGTAPSIYDNGTERGLTTFPANPAGIRCEIELYNGAAVSNVSFYPMIALQSASDPTTFEPYSNICPITGKSSVSLTDTDGTETTTKTVSLGSTLYGGVVDFIEGTANKTMEYIASYNGETINEPWLSSIDEYTEVGTPTTGAQVVYTLATPEELTLTADPLTMYRGTNTLSTSDGSIYIKALTGRTF